MHDYHLMLLPGLLRARQPRLRIGWFLHTPFPSLEVFRTLPMRKEILSGLLAADLLGFHIYDYSRHFLHACTQLMGSELSLESRGIAWDMPLPAAGGGGGGGGTMRHSVRVDAFPIGIDPDRFRRALDAAEVKGRVLELQRQYAGVSVPRRVGRRDCG